MAINESGAFFGWLGLVSVNDSSWVAAALATILVFAALVGIMRYRVRASAEAQLRAVLCVFGNPEQMDLVVEDFMAQNRAVLDAYNEEEQAKSTNSWRSFHGRTQSQDR